MDDMISRQAAIETVRKAKDKSEAHRMLIQLPSAQPVAKDINVPVKDCISRAAALTALERDEEYDKDIPNRADGVRDAIITISALPSAQPELIEKTAYIRGFEQGRTQGMIDSQGGKK